VVNGHVRLRRERVTRRVSVQPRDQRRIAGVIEKLGDRAWAPHQAALEYQRQRHNVVQSQLQIYDKIEASWEKTLKDLKDALNKYQNNATLTKSVRQAVNRAKTALQDSRAPRGARACC